MLNFIRASFIVLAIAAVFPAESKAQLFGKHRHDRCCHSCKLPVAQCCCPAVQQTTYQPVVETQYAQQPVLTHRDVVETQYRTEAVNETIPTVAFDNVCVDEGAYQQVWVPKLVQKQVARTVYEQRTSYRSVPYQVTRRVAECTTQTVPYQTVRYVPTTTNALAWSGATTGYGVAAAPMSATTAFNSNPYGPTVAAAPSYSPPPIASSYPGSGPTPLSSPSPTLVSNGPVPDPRFVQAAATPITPRMASRDTALDGYKIVPEPRDTPRTADAGPLFVPAPSAAAVWRTPRSTITR